MRITGSGSFAPIVRSIDRVERLANLSSIRLATGRRITTAADDPAGSVLSTRLRAQIGTLSTTIQNLQMDASCLSAAAHSLGQINDLLSGMRESVVGALNTSSSETVDAYQDTIDQAVAGINRIARQTTFGSERLLEGSAAINTTSTVATAITDLGMRRAAFHGASALSVQVRITQAASRAGLFVGSGFTSAAAGTVIRLTGPDGTEELSLASSFGAAAFGSAVNALTGDTGVFVSGGAVFSTDYGSDETISLTVLSGDVTFGSTTHDTASSTQSDSGQDIAGFVGQSAFGARGLDATFSSNSLAGAISFHEDTSAGTMAFRIVPSGLSMTSFADGLKREFVGLPSAEAPYLGKDTQEIPATGGTTQTIFGWLNTLTSGGENDVTTDPENALRIVDAAAERIDRMRGFVGGYRSSILDSQLATAEGLRPELIQAESAIGDVDFATEVATWSRLQLLRQAGTAALARMEISQEKVFQLLLGGFMPAAR